MMETMNSSDTIQILAALVAMIGVLVSFIIIWIGSSPRGNIPLGPSIRTRPLRDRESLLRLAKEKEEEMKDDGHERR